MSRAPDTPSTPPHRLPANCGARWTRKPSQRRSSRPSRPVMTRRSRSFMSRLHRHVARRLGLAGQDDVLLLVAGLEAVLDGHGHLAGQELHPAGPAGAYAAGVVDFDADLVRDIQDRLV